MGFSHRPAHGAHKHVQEQHTLLILHTHLYQQGTIYYSVGLTHIVYAMLAVLTLSGVQEDLPKDKRELAATLKTYYSLLQQGGYMAAATYRIHASATLGFLLSFVRDSAVKTESRVATLLKTLETIRGAHQVQHRFCSFLRH